MASTEELACVYSALILQDGNAPVTADNLKTILKTASVDVESYWPGIFAKAVEQISLKDLVSNVGAGGGGAGGAGPAAAAEPEKKEEEKKEEKKEEEEEEDDDMGFGLFD